MKLSWEPLPLRIAGGFTIAHGSYATRENILVHLECDGDTGIGEGALVPYLGETQERADEYLKLAAACLDDEPAALLDALGRLPAGSAAAVAAIDMALHDLRARQIGCPLYQVLELDPTASAPTSVTVRLDTPDAMAAQAGGLQMPILKIKLGGKDDLKAMRAVRAATGAVLRVDVNGGWTLPQARELLPKFAALGVELVEQPLAPDDWRGLQELKKISALPIFADESVRTASNLLNLSKMVDGVVVKISKHGGILNTLGIIQKARTLGLQVMLSCMIESSLGVTAAAHLAPLCDHVDLDAPLLLASDPFRGLLYDGARLLLPNIPGLGVQPA